MFLLFWPQPSGDMMADFKVFKETAVPGVLVPNSILLVAPEGKPGLLEIYVVDNAGVAVRKAMDDARVQAMIDAAVSGASGGLVVVDTITQRDAIEAEGALEVLVLDASADATVETGWARYVWMAGTSTWFKLSEGESQDLVLSWAKLTGKPSSSPSAIDAAVAASHTHTNKTQLDKINQDGEGNLTYGGARPKIAWDGVNW